MSSSDEVVRAQQRKKLYAVEQFGGKCQICGYDKCLNALEFHHIDENKKKHNPSQIILRWSWKRAVTELAKCVLVCANCHRELHTTVKDFNLRSKLRPLIVVECPTCKDKFTTVKNSVAQRYCSNVCARIGGRKVKSRPNVDELRELIETTSFVQVGKIYDVSDNAVRKWAKQYGLL